MAASVSLVSPTAFFQLVGMALAIKSDDFVHRVGIYELMPSRVWAMCRSLSVGNSASHPPPPPRDCAEGAGAAALSALKRGPAAPPVYQGQYDPKALFNALKVFVCQ
jgi:hypothetical protein